MKKLSKALKAGAIAAFAALVIAAPVFAEGIADCTGAGQKYAGLNVQDTASEEYPVKCQRIKTGTTYSQFYGASSADCSQLSSLASDPEACNGSDLNEIIQLIVNVAVIMIILGGISYATSQGDPSKVKKGKDTILYGIIGLIVALLAYAIVNFVLGALQG